MCAWVFKSRVVGRGLCAAHATHVKRKWGQRTWRSRSARSFKKYKNTTTPSSLCRRCISEVKRKEKSTEIMYNTVCGPWWKRMKNIQNNKMQIMKWSLDQKFPTLFLEIHPPPPHHAYLYIFTSTPTQKGLFIKQWVGSWENTTMCRTRVGSRSL